MDYDELIIGGVSFTSRFFLGSGKTSKYTKELIRSAIEDAGTEMISVAVSSLDDEDNVLQYITDGVRILPNTLGATDADEAIKMAHIARDRGLGNMIKIEIMNDSKYLLPDNKETIAATVKLAAEGYIVMPYIYPSLSVCRHLYESGAAALMPLASTSGSNKGLATRDFIEALLKEIPLPIIVDAGIGRPSQACEAMEMGCAAVMANTALRAAGNQPLMAQAFKNAIIAGREAYLSGKIHHN
ncbi:MAG: thiazole synthase [Eubacterium sp.]|nr:thiazole synthase [Eubacterium sp.]